MAVLILMKTDDYCYLPKISGLLASKYAENCCLWLLEKLLVLEGCQQLAQQRVAGTIEVRKIKTPHTKTQYHPSSNNRAHKNHGKKLFK